MPIYRYACPACEVFVEELRAMRHADSLVECPLCHTPCALAIAPVNLVGRAGVPDPAGDPAETGPHAFDPTCSCCVGRASARHT